MWSAIVANEPGNKITPVKKTQNNNNNNNDKNDNDSNGKKDVKRKPEAQKTI